MQTKEQLRADTAEAVAAFHARGGQVTVIPDRATTGLSAKDWARKVRGEKVATPEEIEAERTRRTMIAVENRDADLALRLLQGRFDREIKFDIENDRIGPNGEIR